jgi:hypothetical protein
MSVNQSDSRYVNSAEVFGVFDTRAIVAGEIQRETEIMVGWCVRGGQKQASESCK